MSKHIDFVSKIFINELEKFINDIIKENPELRNEIIKSVPSYSLEFTNNDICNDICEARVFKNGKEARCSVKKKRGDFCGRHSREKKYGRINERIPEEYEKKFIKKLDKEELIKSHIIDIELNLGKLEGILLEEIEINNKKYFYKKDKKNMYIYSYDKLNPTYIGIVKNGFIIGI